MKEKITTKDKSPAENTGTNHISPIGFGMAMHAQEYTKSMNNTRVNQNTSILEK